MKKLLLLASFLMLVVLATAQTTVFSDDFSTNQSATWTTTGQIGSSAFYMARSGADWGGRRNTNGILEVTNDASATGNVLGWGYGYTATTSFSSPYNSTLSSNPGVVTWYANMRQIRTDPAGFGSGNYGSAVILAGSSTTAYNSGTGYAIALGQSGSTDPIRLVRYSAGITALTNLIVSNTTGLTDFGAEYLSIKVTYTPSTNTWELFLRNDGSSAFTDPTSGTLVSQGTVVDNTYTSSSLDYMGAYWQGSTALTQFASFDNFSVSVVPAAGGTPTITVAGIPLANFGGILVGNNSTAQTYTVSGTDLTDDIDVTAPTGFSVSTDGTNWFGSVTLFQSGGEVGETTVYARFSPTAVQSYTGNIAHTSPDAATVNVAVAGTGIKGEPSNHPTAFQAEDGTNPQTDVLVSWTDATGTVIPDGYLIKASSTSLGAITDPVDGTPESNAVLVQNVAAGIQSHNFTNLNSDTTYYFKIYSYTNAGSSINYKLDDTIQTASHTTEVGPAMVEVIVPQYMQGMSSTNNQRIPWACRLTLENLIPSATYRYFGMFVDSADGPTVNGAGIDWFVNLSGNFTRATSLSLGVAGQYGEFSTDANGSYTGWFIGEPSGNGRFTPGNTVWYRMMLNDGNNGTSVATRLTTTSSIKVINFGTQENVNQGTFLYGVSAAPAKDFAFVYDNEAGTGRPIAGTVIESDGLALSAVTSILPAYRDNVDAIEGAWGVIIPNSTGTKGFTGIKRVEARVLETGAVYAQNTDPDGIWNGISTVNPTGGDTTPIDLTDEATLPVELSSFTATIDAHNYVNLTWVTQSETNVMGFYVYRSTTNDLSGAELISTMIPATNTSQQQFYTYTDSDLYSDGLYYYWLQNSDFDGSSNFHGPVHVSYSADGQNNGSPEIPSFTELKAIYPNPFNPIAYIPFSVASRKNVDIKIYNTRGQVVRSFTLGTKEAGSYRLEWNGMDDNGKACSTGVYYVRMTAGNDSFVRKAVLMK